MSRTIMRAIKLDEISAVDNPAQEGARATIVKRAPPIKKDAQTKTQDGEEFPKGDFAYTPDSTDPSTWKLRTTSTPGGSPDADIVGAAAAALSPGGFRGQKVQIPEADRPGVVAKVRAAWIKSNPDKTESDMPTSLTKSGDEQESTMPINANEKPEDAIKRLDGEVKAAAEKAATAEKNAKEQATVAKLNDVAKKAFGDMTTQEKVAFHNASSEDQEAMLAKAVAKSSDANPVIYKAVDGVEYRKNDDPRMVALAKRADESDKASRESVEKAANADFAKRAGTELANLPGDEVVKVAVLKAVEGIKDEAAKKGALALLKAGNTAMKGAFVRKGAGVDKAGETADESTQDGAEAKIDTLAKAIVEKSAGKTSYAAAYTKVLEENPDLYEIATGGDANEDSE